MKADLDSYKFTEEDIVSCWQYHKYYLMGILNLEYSIKKAREDLYGLIDSEFDKRKETKQLTEEI